jgi:hypothetical protein
MAIERVVRCDGASCNVVIEPNKGFAVLGNIHRVDKYSAGDRFDCVGGGLVGNNLEDGEVVRTQHYCETCMARILGFKLILERNGIGTP